MTSIETDFVKAMESALSSLLPVTILPPIVEYLKEQHHLELSVDDLMKVLQFPSESKSETVPAPTGLIPPKIPTASRKSSSCTQKCTLDDVPSDFTGCIYKYKKGIKRNQYCAEPRYHGLMYCKTCKEKKTVKKLLGKEGKLSKTAGSDSISSEKESTPILKVDSFGPEGCDLFIEPKLGFIVRQKSQDNRTIVLAVAKFEDGKIFALSESEKEHAKSVPMAVFKDHEAEQKALSDLKKILFSSEEEEEKEGEEEKEEEKEEKEEKEKEEEKEEKEEEEGEEEKEGEEEYDGSKNSSSVLPPPPSMNIPHTSIPSLAGGKAPRTRSKIPSIPVIPKQIF